MRVFKFRAWDKKENKMYYNVQDTYDYMCNGKGCLEENFGDVLEDDKYIVMQYTGINDIEGNEIYEGDIVKKEIMHSFEKNDLMYDFENTELIGTVQMIEGCWCVVNDKKKLIKNLWDETDVNHVIGNIYDNPKLLEG